MFIISFDELHLQLDISDELFYCPFLRDNFRSLLDELLRLSQLCDIIHVKPTTNFLDLTFCRQRGSEIVMLLKSQVLFQNIKTV